MRPPRPSRRALVAGLGLGLAAPAWGQSPAANLPPLKALARRAGLAYGAAIEPQRLSSDPDFHQLVRCHCAVLVPENAMKWDALRPAPEDFDFAEADAVVALARDQGAAVHGHCLVWHEAMPDWLDAALAAGPRAAEALLAGHVRTVVGRYAGQVRSWDVVNEGVERNDHRPDGLRVSPWLKALGPGYVARAFQLAHAADPGARLALADYGLEYDDVRWMAEKRGTMLTLLQTLKGQGVPIHALALQGHLDGARRPSFGQGLRRFLADVARLGLDIYVTELDINDQRVSGDIAQRDRLVADHYRAFLDVVCDEPAVRMVNTWGLADRYTSKTTMFPRDDGAPVRPLPFDRDLRPKAAAFALADAFSARIRRA